MRASDSDGADSDGIGGYYGVAGMIKSERWARDSLP
jgi:hypothetical protein